MNSTLSTGLLALSTLALTIAGCQMCTLIGCTYGLTVRLDGVVPDEYTVTVSSPTAGTLSRSCSATAPCHQNVVGFDSYTPSEVTVTVAWGDGDVGVTVHPAYQVSRPNGPDCDPECWQATITLQIS